MNIPPTSTKKQKEITPYHCVTFSRKLTNKITHLSTHSVAAAATVTTKLVSESYFMAKTSSSSSPWTFQQNQQQYSLLQGPLTREEALNMGVAAEGSQGLYGPCSQNVLMISCCSCCSKEWAYAENPLVIPGLLVAIDDSCPEAPGRIEACASNGDGRQMHHEYCKPNRQWSQYRDMGVPSIALRISGRENSVNQDESANDLSRQPHAFSVAVSHRVGSASIFVVVGFLERLHQPTSAYGSQTLGHHVENCPRQGHLPCQKQPKSHGRVDMPT